MFLPRRWLTMVSITTSRIGTVTSTPSFAAMASNAESDVSAITLPTPRSFMYAAVIKLRS